MDFAVLDSSVAIKWFVSESDSDDALRVLERFRAGLMTLLAPEMIHAEMGNIVWKKCRLQGLAAADGEAILAAWHALPIICWPTRELLDEAFAMAITHQRTVYDSLYVALSMRVKCPLLAADQRLANALDSHIPGVVVWIRDWR